MVEVTSVANRVSQVSDVTNAVRHAIDKVADRQGTPTPIKGSPQALIHMTLDVGRTPLRGQVREILPDGTLTLLPPRRHDPDQVERTSGNLYDDIAETSLP